MATGLSIAASVAFGQDKLFVASTDGFLYALDPATGKELWKFRTPWSIGCAPVFVDGLVLQACYQGPLFALEAASGRERWRVNAGTAVFASPVPGAQALYAPSTSSVVALAGEEGANA